MWDVQYVSFEIVRMVKKKNNCFEIAFRRIRMYEPEDPLTNTMHVCDNAWTVVNRKPRTENAGLQAVFPVFLRNRLGSKIRFRFVQL